MSDHFEMWPFTKGPERRARELEPTRGEKIGAIAFVIGLTLFFLFGATVIFLVFQRVVINVLFWCLLIGFAAAPYINLRSARRRS